jgi:SAM-dependent methyltransferase
VVELAGRCDLLRSSDPVPDAVGAARERTRGLSHVEVTVDALPEAIGAAPVDLVVVSEVLYYLDDATVAATLDRIADVLEPGGDVVAVHWRGWPPEAPRDAVATHRVLASHPALEQVVVLVDEEFLLCVLRRR